MARPRSTTCKNGHEWTDENTYIQPGPVFHRSCRICNKARHKYEPGDHARKTKARQEMLDQTPLTAVEIDPDWKARWMELVS